MVGELLEVAELRLVVDWLEVVVLMLDVFVTPVLDELDECEPVPDEELELPVVWIGVEVVVVVVVVTLGPAFRL